MDVFKRKEFATALRVKRAIERLSMREAADAIGISIATLCRIENENTPDIYSYNYCCRWLGVELDTYFKKKANGKQKRKV